MAGRALLDLFYSPCCAFCSRPDRRGVCPDCEARLPRPAHPVWERPDVGCCAAPMAYRGMAREAVMRFKFGRKPELAAGLALLLARCAAELPAFDLVTWVPLSDRRRRERGYDQARLLARSAGRALGKPSAALLKKVRHNPPQSGSDEETRRSNVSGAYRALSVPQGARILLIDDVITTGATLAECRRVLLEAGAASVVCACAAAAEAPWGRRI